MRQIVFDIETCSLPLESLSDSQKEYLFRYAEKEKDPAVKEEKYDEAVRYLSLYPYTSKVIAISIYDLSKSKYLTYFESESPIEWNSEDNAAYYKGLPEPDILSSFWKIISQVDQVITFNGKYFDVPFLLLRSAVLRVKPSKLLSTSKYDNKTHIDLLDQLTFSGLTKKFNLDFYCQSFGIQSSKNNEVNGMEVKTLYEAGKIKEIAQYCKEDVRATFELYQIWNEFLNIK